MNSIKKKYLILFHEFDMIWQIMIIFIDQVNSIYLLKSKFDTNETGNKCYFYGSNGLFRMACPDDPGKRFPVVTEYRGWCYFCQRTGAGDLPDHGS